MTYDITHLFHYAEEVLGDTINDSLETRAIDFLLWCNTPVFRPDNNLGFMLRVTAQFPEYNTFIVIDRQGNKRHDEPYITVNQVYDLYLNDIT